MDAEAKVCTPEQAKKLVELGLVLKTQHYWVEADEETKKKGIPWLLYRNDQRFGEDPEYYIPAPDVAELGQILPGKVRDKHGDEDWQEHTGYFASLKDRDKNGTEFWRSEFGDVWVSGAWENEAQARAEAFIWAVDEGCVKAGEAIL